MQNEAARQLYGQYLFLCRTYQLRLGAHVQRAVVLVHPPLHGHAHRAAVGQCLGKLDALAVVQFHIDLPADPFDVDGAEAVQLRHRGRPNGIARVRGIGGLSVRLRSVCLPVSAARQHRQCAQQ